MKVAKTRGRVPETRALPTEKTPESSADDWSVRGVWGRDPSPGREPPKKVRGNNTRSTIAMSPEVFQCVYFWITLESVNVS